MYKKEIHIFDMFLTSRLHFQSLITTQKALESRLAAIERTERSRLATGAATSAPTATGKGRSSSTSTRAGGPKVSRSRKMLETTKPVRVQGNTLKTFSFSSPLVERVQVVLATEGRPLDAEVELWQGPDNTPQRMRVYIEDGSMRPFNAVIETPRSPNTISVINTSPLEFPLSAYVAAADSASPGPSDFTTASEFPRTIQGGALRTFAFEPSVESVQISLKTDGRPLNARIELLQGPNNNKQVVDLYTEDGYTRPFFAIIDTPGAGNVVRVVNTSPVEFPLTAWVEPYEVGNDSTYSSEPVLGGDRDDTSWGRSGDNMRGRPW